MRELYELIMQNKEHKAYMLVSGISGCNCGEKVLYLDGQAVYKTRNADKMMAYEDLYMQVSFMDSCEMGICETEGGMVFVERLGMSGRIIVCGAGTVGQEVIRLCKQLGYTVAALEDRPEYAKKARLLGADEVYCGAFTQSLSELRENAGDYYVVVTREHQYDKACLRQILSRKKAYVGLMSSRNRAKVLKEDLVREGIAEHDAAQIHSPIGLSIYAETSAEIAVSIMAEIIQHRGEHKKSEDFDKAVLQAIVESAAGEKLIMATIVRRCGSAPRDVGSRMVIRENGTIVGSVGGGWIEAGVLELAKNMFADGRKHELYETDKDSEGAVLCGGYETIYLERIS